MGCAVEVTATGQVVDVHRFDSYAAGVQYLHFGRGYRYERNEPWAFTSGIDFYQGPEPAQRASLRKHNGFWEAAFWEQKK